LKQVIVVAMSAKNRSLPGILLLVLALTGCGKSVESGQTTKITAATLPGGNKIALRILYAGHTGSARERDFVKFLGEIFSSVATTDLARFTPANADGADVVLMDYDGDGFKAPRPRLDEGYARATVTIGVVGGFIGGNLRLKTGYL
jgi:hypothetical protein